VLPYLPPSEKANIGDMRHGTWIARTDRRRPQRGDARKDATRLSTLRLINAAVKDQDIAVRGKGQGEEVGEAMKFSRSSARWSSSARKARAPMKRAGGWSWPKRNARKSR
jgi:hypothetical protein